MCCFLVMKWLLHLLVLYSGAFSLSAIALVDNLLVNSSCHYPLSERTPFSSTSRGEVSGQLFLHSSVTSFHLWSVFDTSDVLNGYITQCVCDGIYARLTLSIFILCTLDVMKVFALISIAVRNIKILTSYKCYTGEHHIVDKGALVWCFIKHWILNGLFM